MYLQYAVDSSASDQAKITTQPICHLCVRYDSDTATLMQEFLNYVGGKWTKSKTGKTFQVSNPANASQILGNFQLTGQEDVQDDMKVARDGLKRRATTPAPHGE